MAEEIQLDGKEYVSSKRAADLSGYAQDYIGQLARSGQIEARRIGGLWYVLPESLHSYKENAAEYVATPHSPELRSVNPDAFISFEGKDYVSSIRASKLTGYNQDYIGQLARSGRVLSRQIGNRWYIDRESLLGHKKEKDGLLGAVQAQSVGLAKPVAESGLEASPKNDDLYFNYISEREDLLPAIFEKSEVDTSELSDKHVLNLHSKKIANPLPVDQRAVPGRTSMSQRPQVALSPQGLSTTSKSRPSSLKKHAVAGVLVVVVVLGGGLVALKGKSVYVFASREVPDKTSLKDMDASAASAFNQLGSSLEQRFVHEIQYQRTD